MREQTQGMDANDLTNERGNIHSLSTLIRKSKGWEDRQRKEAKRTKTHKGSSTNKNQNPQTVTDLIFLP